MNFCEQLGLEAALVMLDPNSSQPPPPDIECRFPDGSHYLELAEIIQESIAEACSPKNNDAIVRRNDPLARIWETLWKTLTKKLGKSYNTQARPRSRPVVDEKASEIRKAFLDSGNFDQVFVFDVRQRRVLLGFLN